jgi:hypothetical protein
MCYLQHQQRMISIVMNMTKYGDIVGTYRILASERTLTRENDYSGESQDQFPLFIQPHEKVTVKPLQSF